MFGEQKGLEPMSPDTRARWKKEIDWLLSVTDHIVEFVPSQQKTNGMNMEVTITISLALSFHFPSVPKHINPMISFFVRFDR